ncbi:MAG: cysteine synthase A [Solobacterium sp.]|nr:cysteine synthase A [Solobacterium sp.]
MLVKSMTDLIGNTPLLECRRMKEMLGLKGNLFAKAELFNATGSAKDRAALCMVREAEASGILQPGGTIIEPTSGNTGIGLAAVGAQKGYRVIIIMPDTMSKERITLMKAYGAEVILTDGKLGMNGAIEEAKKRKAGIEGAFIPDQFSNPANPKAHYETTGPEIVRDLAGKVDVLVAGVGTGGTLTGIASYLKDQNLNTEIIAVEPENSAVLSGRKAGAHGLQGIGAGFIPDALDPALISRIITVKEEDAFRTARMFARWESLLCGISSGAALYAAAETAKLPKYQDCNIVAILPDSGDRYLSAGLFEE